MPWLGDRFRDRFSAEGFDRHLFPAGMQRRFDDHARLGAAGYKAKVKHSAQPGGSKARVLQRYNTSLADGMATYLGEMYGLDVHIGRLLAALDETRVRDNTVVLFSSDHGPEQTRENELGSTGPGRGGKQSAFEGGIRLPYIIRWPGRIPPGYVDSTSLIGNVDWAPTIARLARLPDSSTPRFDGVSVARRWKGSAGDRSGGALFAWCLHGHKVAIRGPRGLKAFAWAERTFGLGGRNGKRRTVVSSCLRPSALYDVDVDPGERSADANLTHSPTGALLPRLARLHALLQAATWSDVHVARLGMGARPPICGRKKLE